MKLLRQIPHANFNITLFWWNQKYILKFEQDNLEQTFKISELDIVQESEIDQIIDNQVFITNVKKRFLEMHNDLLQTLNPEY
jgi:hypothetical protein